MRYLVTVDERPVTISLPDADGAALRAEVDGAAIAADWRALEALSAQRPAGHYSLLVGLDSYDVFVRRLPADDEEEGDAARYELRIGGQVFTVIARDERTQALGRLAAAARHTGEAVIRAPMPGLVSNIMVEEGQEVARGQAIVALEAMKMENDLSTPRAGVVKAIRVRKGQTVNQGETLAIIGDPAAGAEANEADGEAEVDSAD